MTDPSYIAVAFKNEDTCTEFLDGMVPPARVNLLKTLASVKALIVRRKCQRLGARSYMITGVAATPSGQSMGWLLMGRGGLWV